MHAVLSHIISISLLWIMRHNIKSLSLQPLEVKYNFTICVVCSMRNSHFCYFFDITFKNYSLQCMYEHLYRYLHIFSNLLSYTDNYIYTKIFCGLQRIEQLELSYTIYIDVMENWNEIFVSNTCRENKLYYNSFFKKSKYFFFSLSLFFFF